MVKLKYSFPAVQDLKNIHDYIAEDSSLMAKRFIRLLTGHIKTFKQFPEAGQAVFPDRYKNLKQRLYKSYRIIYEVTDDEINIVTIHHQSRLLENINSLKDYEIK